MRGTIPLLCVLLLATASSAVTAPSHNTMPTTSVASSAADSLVGVRDVSAKELVRLVCDTPTESLVRFVDLDLDEADEAVVSVLCGNADLTTTGIFVSGPASPALVDT